MKIFLLLFLYSLSAYTFGCSCVTISDESVFNDSDSVVVGRVISANLIDGDKLKAVLRVDEVLKGKATKQIYLYSSGKWSDKTCFTTISVGMNYIIFSKNEKNNFISSCSSSRMIDVYDEKKRLEILNKLRMLNNIDTH